LGKENVLQQLLVNGLVTLGLRLFTILMLSIWLLLVVELVEMEATTTLTEVAAEQADIAVLLRVKHLVEVQQPKAR